MGFNEHGPLHICQYAMNQEADSLAKEGVTRSEFMTGTI